MYATLVQVFLDTVSIRSDYLVYYKFVTGGYLQTITTAYALFSLFLQIPMYSLELTFVRMCSLRNYIHTYTYKCTFILHTTAKYTVSQKGSHQTHGINQSNLN